MTVIFLYKFSESSKVLKYDQGSGEFSELLKDEISKDDLKLDGFYEKVGEDFIGIRKSTNGPICFYSIQEYELANSQFHSNLTQHENHNQFCLFLLDECLFCITYERPPLGWDNWSSTEAEVDLFTWLHIMITDPKKKEAFISKFTI